MISGVRAVLFDAVGTLIRPEPAVAEAYWQAGRQFGSVLRQDEIAARFRTAFATHFGPRHDSPTSTSEADERRRWHRVVAEVFVDVPGSGGELFDTLWNHFAQSRNWVVFSDVVETWRELSERGVTIGIASNFDERLRAICRGLDPLSQCERLFHSSRIGFAKPRREFFRAIERELGLAPHQLLLVGDDGENDFAGARNAGWHALLLDRSGCGGGESSIAVLGELLPLLA